MDTFSIRDLRERVGELSQQLEAGHLSVISKHGQALAVTVPVDEMLLKSGAMFALSARMFQQGLVSGGIAGKLCGMTRLDFYDALGRHGIPVVNYPPQELTEELAVLHKGLNG